MNPNDDWNRYDDTEPDLLKALAGFIAVVAVNVALSYVFDLLDLIGL